MPLVNFFWRLGANRGLRSLKRGFVLVALCAVFAIILLVPSVREHLSAVYPVEYVDVSSFGFNFPKTAANAKPVLYNLYPTYNDAAWNATWRGTYQPCKGPFGSLLGHKDEAVAMKGHRWHEEESPTPIFGSYEAWSLNHTFCTDRYSRYGAYAKSRKFRTVDWAALQQSCLQRNADRYRTLNPKEKLWTLHKCHDVDDDNKQAEEDSRAAPNGDNHAQRAFHPRTAVILRTWLNMKYTDDTIQMIRSMVMELSLLSGAEYEVVILIDSKDTDLPDPADQAEMGRFKNKYLPRELQDLAVFFNARMLNDWYPMIGVHEAILQYFQPVQIFSRLNPQYDHIWQFEMDSRYIGNLYHLLERATSFAQQQPRRNLWERNSYFYIPPVHGSWAEFVERVDKSMVQRDSIWGPRPAAGINVSKQAPVPPNPDSEVAQRNWGVGEEADLITWLPQFNPNNTGWPFRDRIYNFPQEGATPRRASVVAMSRISSRLLRLMHADQVEKGVGLASEMSPVSWALYYGLKAVQIPHPIYHPREFDAVELSRRVNPGEPGGISAGPDSIWSWQQHDDILMNVTYMFASEYPEKLYRTWLGYDDAKAWERQRYQLCLPPMFLHPVKNTEK